MIAKHYFRKDRCFCKSPELIENYDKAVADDTQIWLCHHRDEIRILPSGMIVLRSASELKENGRYYNCPPEELIFLTNKEHTSLHNKHHSVFKNSEVQRQNGKKGAASIKRKIENGELSYKGENNPMYGKNAWAIACSRKTPEEIEATRKSKSEKMKEYWRRKRNAEGN